MRAGSGQLAFTANGKSLVSAGWDGTLRVWQRQERIKPLKEGLDVLAAHACDRVYGNPLRAYRLTLPVV